MKLQTLVRSASDLKALAEVKLKDIKTSWRFGLFLSKVNTQLSIYDKLKDQLVSTYGEEKIPESGQYEITNVGEFIDKLKELENEDVLLDDSLPNLTLSTYLESKVKPSTLYSLAWLIKDDVDLELSNTKTLTKQEASSCFIALTILGSKEADVELSKVLVKLGQQLYPVVSSESNDPTDLKYTMIPFELLEKLESVEPVVFVDLHWLIK